MAHSHTKSMLASLGFQDKDRNNPLHDMACRYLAQTEQMQAVSRHVSHKNFTADNAEVEFELTKGRDQYRTTVGFIDVVLGYRRRQSVVVEVKIERVSVNEVLKQLKLYRGYYELDDRPDAGFDIDNIRQSYWVLASPWTLRPEEVRTLTASGVQHIRLGPKFDAWVESQRTATTVADSAEF